MGRRYARVAASEAAVITIVHPPAAAMGRKPPPVMTLNRAVAVWKLRGREAALEMIDPLNSELETVTFIFTGCARSAQEACIEFMTRGKR